MISCDRNFAPLTFNDNDMKNRTRQNAEMIIPFALEKYQLQLQQQNYNHYTYSTSFSGIDSTWARIEPWGCFLLCTGKSKIDEISATRTFLAGVENDETQKYVLVTGDQTMSLVVAGSTEINGDVMVNTKGMQTGMIRGVPFEGDNPVNGAVYQDSVTHLPEAETDFLFYQRDQLKNFLNHPDSLETIHDLTMNNDTLFLENNQIMVDQSQGFNMNNIKGPGAIYFTSPVILSEIKLHDQITIYSDDPITFQNNFYSENVLVFAPEINIIGAQNINGQFYATDSLNVDQGAALTYPSILGLVSNDTADNERILNIGNNVNIFGSIILNTGMDICFRDKLRIHESVIIHGLTYSNHYTELHGIVNGIVMTELFWYYEWPMVYINWLINANINSAELMDDFICPVCFDREFNLNQLYETN